MIQKIMILFLTAIFVIVSSTGCKKDISQKFPNGETDFGQQPSHDDMAEEKETIIYILSVSSSARLIDRYTYEKNGELNKSSLPFDNDCHYYNNQELLWNRI